MTKRESEKEERESQQVWQEGRRHLYLNGLQMYHFAPNDIGLGREYNEVLSNVHINSLTTPPRSAVFLPYTDLYVIEFKD